MKISKWETKRAIGEENKIINEYVDLKVSF